MQILPFFLNTRIPHQSHIIICISFKLIWENLVKSVGAFGGAQTGLLSAVMNHLSPPLPHSPMSNTSHKRINMATGSPSTTIESSIPKGLYNFAPLAVVTYSNPTARPADALVKSTKFFNRTKVTKLLCKMIFNLKKALCKGQNLGINR